MTAKKLSLGEKIALAASGAQQDDEFPEDIEYDTSARVVDIDDDDENEVRRPVRSSLRTKNVKLLEELDERYSGLKVSRKKLSKTDKLAGSKTTSSIKYASVSNTEDEGIEGSSDEEIDSETSIINDDSIEDDYEGSSGSVDESADNQGALSDSLDDIEESSGGDVNSSEEDEEKTESPAMQTLSSRDHQAEVEKGKATLNQIRIWDSLLEVRIRLQKMLLDCNRLPNPNSFEEILNQVKQLDNGSATSALLEKSQEAIKVLMHELLRLQNTMVHCNTEVRKSLDDKSAESKEAITSDPMSEEITSDTDEEDDIHNEEEAQLQTKFKRKMDMDDVIRNAKKMKLEEFETSSVNFFQTFLPYRNQIVQRWNDKTQFAGGKFNKKASQQISTLHQIEQILSNKERLLKRTQVKRSNYSVIGVTENDSSVKSDNDVVSPNDEQNLDSEIFDDDDFYHQLLRDLIERKTSNVNDPIQLSQHWLDLQKLRSKLKRKVDTKASKGRKIRYDVHSKLVNFMAPQDSCAMSTAAVKELFASLFGKSISKE